MGCPIRTFPRNCISFVEIEVVFLTYLLILLPSFLSLLSLPPFSLCFSPISNFPPPFLSDSSPPPDLEYSTLMWGDQSLTMLCSPNEEPHLAIPELISKVHVTTLEYNTPSGYDYSLQVAHTVMNLPTHYCQEHIRVYIPCTQVRG